MNNPIISFGFPVYNGENFLMEALDSILAQTYDNFEIIISDNASTDNTPEICKKYAQKDRRVLYHRNKRNIGAAKNYNLVFKLSSGKYFKWATHDDLIAPEFLEQCITVLEEKQDVVLCYPRIIYINSRADIINEQKGMEICIDSDSPSDRLSDYFNYQIHINDVINWAIFGLIRHEALQKTQLIGSFLMADWFLETELVLLGKFFQVPRPLFFLRKHPKTSHRKNRSLKDIATWFDPELGRKKIILPFWNMFIKNLTLIKHIHLKPSEKYRCYYFVLRYFLYHKWREMGRDSKNFLKQLVRKNL